MIEQSQIGQHGEKNHPQSLTNLQKFLHTYSSYIGQNPKVELNTSTIISDISTNILQPPKNSRADLLILYNKGKQLENMIQQDQLSQTVSKLKKLKEDKIYQTVLFIQQLNFQLNKEYQFQVNKGIQNGVYSQRMQTTTAATGNKPHK